MPVDPGSELNAGRAFRPSGAVLNRVLDEGLQDEVRDCALLEPRLDGNVRREPAAARERLLVADDPAMERLLTRLGVTFERTQAVFIPIGLSHRHERHDH